MSHWAKVNNGIVEQVIVITDGAEDEYFANFKDTSPGHWIQTSYTSSIRANFAGIGYHYDHINDVFYPPKPYNSWVLNTTTWSWEAPTPLPADAGIKVYKWNEETQSWNEVTE